MNNEIKRIKIVCVRHAHPKIDSETKRSLDIITLEGAKEALRFGEQYSTVEGKLLLYHSGMQRAVQTVSNINVGIGNIADEVEGLPSMLGLNVFKGKKLPQGIPYGRDFINYVITENPTLIADLTEMTQAFLKQSYEKSNNFEENSLVIGVSHGPIVEIGSGILMGYKNKDLGDLAAEPLGYFELTIDQHKPSGNIQQSVIKYKDQSKIIAPFL